MFLLAYKEYDRNFNADNSFRDMNLYKKFENLYPNYKNKLDNKKIFAVMCSGPIRWFRDELRLYMSNHKELQIANYMIL